MPDSRVLVLRMSAMGDVALTLPLVAEAAKQNKIVVVTRPLFSAFFENIEGLEIVNVDTSGVHKGLIGIFRLYREIRRKYSIKAIVDLHSVLRSIILSNLFKFSGVSVFSIDKGRKAKRRFIKTGEPVNLIHTTDRYRKVFNNAGIKIDRFSIPAFIFSRDEINATDKYLEKILSDQTINKIAIAPFAKHRTKQWSTDSIGELISLLDKNLKCHFFLFGGPDEKDALSKIAGDRVNISNLSGLLPIRLELALISQMTIMLCMDSSNMHMASMAGVSTISIWGGTAPETGFSPIGYQEHIIIETPLEEIDCRPCTIYGKGECKRETEKYKCLSDIKPEYVSERIINSGLLKPA